MPMSRVLPSMPRLWALVCVSTQTIEYSSTRYSAVASMLSTIPETVRDNFALCRYNPDPNYADTVSFDFPEQNTNERS